MFDVSHLTGERGATGSPGSPVTCGQGVDMDAQEKGLTHSRDVHEKFMIFEFSCSD